MKDYVLICFDELWLASRLEGQDMVVPSKGIYFWEELSVSILAQI
jgi:hypothetical protein